MKTLEQWFSEYGESHQNKTNVYIHKVCVPLITWSLLGILWTIPVPELFLQYGINWTYVFVLICLLFYISLKSIRVIFGVLTLVLPIVYLLHEVSAVYGHRILYVSIAIFVLAWIGQFVGHKIEGKKPSFFQDIQFLLVGPAWVLKDILRIKY